MKNQLKNRFSEFVTKKNLLGVGDRVLVAVSGGLDSMVLLHLLLQWRHKFQIELGVVHLHHQIREKSADEDVSLVQQFCDERDIPSYILYHSTIEYAKKRKQSLEEAGHLLRKKLFEELAAKHGFQRIATGHHQDDQAETVLMRLISGTGLQGLSGIRLKHEKWIRPLLFATRDDISQYAHLNSVPFREDETNEDLSILRNKIRHQLLPLLKKEYDTAISAHLTQLSGVLEEWDIYLKDEIEGISQKYLKQHYENKIEVGIAFFQLYFSWIKIQMLELILTRINQNKVKISFTQYSDFSHWVDNGNIGSQFQWNYGILAVKREKSIDFYGSQLNSQISDIEVLKSGKSYHLPNSNIKLSINAVSPEMVDFNSDRSVEYISGDKITFPLKLRPWRTGDRFKPLGFGTNRLVSDFLTDKKVGFPEKQNVYVLTSESGIIAIIGYQISDDYKITEATKQIYRLSIIEEKK
jgi:tRNA(Ile)-lysidine synthase